ncbi:hypothetical protein J1P26_22795 [Neobacillus sp. MM2021_6]|uniref:hypothetical protein n=1 Tax=Bacillaceae TaxID=186817 RepID=UPI001408C487|nr:MULTISPECIES: hypothetical protein [Bacillaceae]MBO0962527.1 hypothetical protein [Neobacillus sp. MM2021_6]NHC20995.1 hypothetical protein [Bacillus sp. MM2020_4]
MEITLNLMDKVVHYKGRVWTIYSTSHDGVFAYQGLKPFASFNYNEDSRKYSTFKKNIVYIKNDEITILTGDEIQAAVKKEEKEMRKPLSRKKAIDFYVYLTGHSKAFVSKHIQERHRGFGFIPGAVGYDLWKHNRGERSFLILSHNMENHTQHAYFDFITFETDDLEHERSWEAIKQEIIDNYKEWQGIE